MDKFLIKKKASLPKTEASSSTPTPTNSANTPAGTEVQSKRPKSVDAADEPMDVEESKTQPVDAAANDDSDAEDDRPLKSRKTSGASIATPQPSVAASSSSAAALDDTSSPALDRPPATAAIAAEAYAAASTGPRSGGGGSPVNTAGSAEKTVTFSFLKDKRDARGKREGEEGYDKTTLQVRLDKRSGEKFTPGQEQYWAIKQKYADCIIAFKMGKFYELFEEDALIGHRELDLAFMGKGAPHAGFPEAALPKYAAKLVELGYKVGVVEQMETPEQLAIRNKAKPKGEKKEAAVRREICSVITKGTSFHRDDKSTYLLCVSEDVHSKTLGVAFADASTGHVHLGQCLDDEHHNSLRTLLAQLRPDEVLVDESHVSRGAYLLLRRAVPSGLFNALPAAAFYADRADAEAHIAERKYFVDSSITGGSDGVDNWPEPLRAAAAADTPVALRAFGGCARYLQRLLLDEQLLTMRHMSMWVPTDGEASIGHGDGKGSGHAGTAGASLILDAKALENLEVFANSSDGSSKGSLFGILDKCVSSFGRRALRSWLCAPPRQIGEIVERQQMVSALVQRHELRSTLAKYLAKLPDLERLLARVHAFSVAHASNDATHYSDVGKARLNELIKTLEGFEALDAGVRKCAGELADLAEEAPALASTLTIGEGFPDLAGLLATFRDAFDWTQAKQEGRVIPKRGADDAYDAAKEEVDGAKGEIDEILKYWKKELNDKSIELWSAAGSPTEPFQLAVSEDTLKRRGTPDEFTQMSAKKGTVRFWTPDLKAAVASYLSAKEHLDAALSASARKLYAKFSKQFARWHNAVACASDLDCLLSLAAFSAAPDMCKPTFVPRSEGGGPFLHVKQGINICVRASLGAGYDCIPNDIIIGSSADQTHAADDGNATSYSPPMLLVTGPNMGGKSTLLRQACLTALLAHLGCYVPAQECSLTPVDRIFTRVGANDAIMAGLSTFRVELEETASILQHATCDSMVILDELGRGTATFDGMAIAHAVLSHLIHETGCRSLFATHYHALTREFEVPNPKVALYHMACAVDEASRDVTFLYKFIVGASHKSNGVNVARLAGLPESVLDVATRKSESLERLVDDKYAVQLANRLLRATRGGGTAAAAASTSSAADGVLALWQEVRAAAATAAEA